MKLLINYDLMTKIEEAEGKCILKRSIKSGAIEANKWISLSCGISLFLSLFSENPIEFIDDIPLKAALFYGFNIPFEFLTNNIVKEKTKKEAKQELAILSIKLNQLNVSTSLELLLDSEVYDKNYKYSLNKDKSASIIQNKYINVPVYNDGNIEYTSIHQEHKLGSKEYVLSIGSPTKAKSFKPTFSAI